MPSHEDLEDDDALDERVVQDGDDDGPLSETPCFDALFGRYDLGHGAFGTEHLGSLLLDMGFNCAPRVLDRALDEMDPNATGEIAKLTFLEWFEANAEDIDLPGASSSPSPRSAAAASATSPRRAALDDDEVDERAVTQMTSAMLDAKNQRRRAEEDVQVLQNRLAHLRGEHARAQRRIDEANRRASEIEAVKRRNAEHQRAKQRAMEDMAREVRRMRDTNQLATTTSRERRQQSASAVAAFRAQMVHETRVEHKAHLTRIAQSRAHEQRALSERSQEIRAQERSALQRRDQLKQQQQRELYRSARANLAREHERKLLSERLIRTMEAEEARLIEELRISHEMQRAAYEHLEFVIHEADGN